MTQIDYTAALRSEGNAPPGHIPLALSLAPPQQPATGPAPPPTAPAQPAVQVNPLPPPAVTMPVPQMVVSPQTRPWFFWQHSAACLPWSSIYQGSSYGSFCSAWDRQLSGLVMDGLVRGYFLDDQRVQWSGMETTLGAEAVFAPRWVHQQGPWTIAANSEFFINQPFDRNILITPERESYVNNFQPDAFEIWNLNLSVERGDFRFAIGKDNTPFGRYYFPIFTNARLDAPFIRNEAINFVETGAFLRYTPRFWAFDIAIVNGGTNRDTNSSKAGVARVGVQFENFAAGVSAKVQDGVGSEMQKLNKTHFGADALVRAGHWDLSGEVIYDEYGFRKPFDPDDIFWGRSIYYRDLYNGTENGALHGVGYYVNLGHTRPRLRADLNYGEFYPGAIGNPLHDTPNRRLIGKLSWLVFPRLESYTAVMFENRRPAETWRQGESPFFVVSGLQAFF